MTNLSKNGARQTALDLDGRSFDEATYRAELIAAGLPADDAAAVASKTAAAHREALSLNQYRVKLIDSGMGVEQAKRAAAAAARFNSSPAAKQIEPGGQVVIAKAEQRNTLLLENGDVIRIPAKGGLVLIGGEVLFPYTVDFDKKFDIDTYINLAGGYT